MACHTACLPFANWFPPLLQYAAREHEVSVSQQRYHRRAGLFSAFVEYDNPEIEVQCKQRLLHQIQKAFEHFPLGTDPAPLFTTMPGSYTINLMVRRDPHQCRWRFLRTARCDVLAAGVKPTAYRGERFGPQKLRKVAKDTKICSLARFPFAYFVGFRELRAPTPFPQTSLVGYAQLGNDNRSEFGSTEPSRP